MVDVQKKRLRRGDPGWDDLTFEEKYPGMNFKPDPEACFHQGGHVVMNYFFGASLCGFLPLCAIVVTHVIPMLVLYFYIPVGILVFMVCGGFCLRNCIAGTPETTDGKRDDSKETTLQKLSHSLTVYMLFYVMFIVILQSLVTYAILLYGRGFEYYGDGIVDEINSRSTGHWARCVGIGDPLTLLDSVRSWI